MSEDLRAAAILKASQVVTPVGGLGAIFGYLTFTEWLALGGFIIALVGVCIQFYYSRKKDKREQEVHDMFKATQLYDTAQPSKPKSVVVTKKY